MFLRLYWFALVLFLLGSCSDSQKLMDDNEISTYDIIQSRIWDRYCINCHNSNSAFGRQSSLILSPESSYEQLLNILPANQAAASDGLVRVSDLGLEGLYRSYLWEKINYPDFAHFYEDHAQYGELMPFGGPSLSYGELEFIRKWIIAGAPRTGVVAEESLLGDSLRFEIPESEFTRLEPPSQGIQLHLGPFDVEANSEREFFFFSELNNPEEFYINRYEINMREGSHHFILYDFPGEVKPNPGEYRDFYDQNGSLNLGTALSILNQRFVIGTQTRKTEYRFPAGVALKVKARKGFDLNSHYVNRSNERKIGEVSVNLHTIPKEQVERVAENLFESYQDIVLPPNQITTLSRTSRFNKRMHIFQLTSHAHENLIEYKVFIDGGLRDGELVYFSKDWEHPPLLQIDPPLVLEAGEGLRSVATYNNKTARTLRFGLRSTDEMMIVFGMYYTD